MTQKARKGMTLARIARMAWRGFVLRCPHCGQGRMFAGPVAMRASCDVCAHRFEFHPGNWSGAVMISQMLMGLFAIPVWIVFTVVFDLDFTRSVVWTVVVVLVFWFVTYRNVKGLWYGWLHAVNRDDDHPGPGATQRDHAPQGPAQR